MDKRNRSLRKGIYNTIPKNINAPDVTYQSAEFGDLSVFNIVLVQDLLVNINAKFATIRVVNVKALASISPCPLLNTIM